MIRKFTSENQKIGELGENIACNFLLNKDFKIIERNYTRKWGEIDIIASKENKLHFIEVKSVSRNIDTKIDKENTGYRPEDNMHMHKIIRMHRVIQTYLIHKKLENTSWQIDLLLVYIDKNKRLARVKSLENIII